MIGLREDQRMKARMVNFLNHTASHCRSELAREERKDPAFNQMTCVIVDDFREQARSYRGLVKPGVGSAASKPAG
ncbi:hypothetical protein SAMN04490210_0654 [Pseudomonas sp. bs2935]|jgi:flagellar biosynthesis component FlhA|nr:hypothetical protein SAMN04490210_0654 [Pseudomonas sp. bs2935]